MTSKTISLYKNIGETPLELLNRFREVNPDYKDEKIAYAGRLDPMAHGLMLYLVGDECKKRDKYQDMDKTYEFDLVCGFKTDTHDLLGIVESLKATTSTPQLMVQLQDELHGLVGELRQEYPAYSSKTIDGVPMYKLAREGQLGNKEIPSKQVTIYKAELLEEKQLPAKELLDSIIDRINKVNGDFRQQEIIDKWKSVLIKIESPIPTYKVRISASSGTYIRSIANQLGINLGTYALAMDILRTKVGGFTHKDVITLK